MIPAADTRWQRAAGIRESPEDLARDVLAKNGDQGPRDLTLALCRRAPELVEWLADAQGLALELVTDFRYPGHTEYRMHAPPERTGRALFAGLREAVARQGNIDLVLGAAGTGLIADGDGVTGVMVDAGGRTEYVRARKVILAVNGFAGNPDMVARYIPDMAGAPYFGGHGSTGDGIRWGMALGAATAYMGAYQAHASVAEPGGALVSYAVIMLGGIQLNRAGLRFADESRGYSEHALDVLKQPGGVAVEIFDRRIYEQALSFPDFRECVEHGLVRCGGSPGELARSFGLPEEALRESVEASNRANRLGQADEVGRPPTGTPLAPPLYGIQVTGAMIHTQGGLVVNARAQVCRRDGSPIPNLYAGGGVAAGISGPGPGGYLSGNGLLTALGYGRIAGEHAAASL